MKLIVVLCMSGFYILGYNFAFSQNQISQSVFGNGSTPISSSTYYLTSTLGQNAIGLTQNTLYQHSVGYWYGFNIIVGIVNTEDQLPKQFDLYQNYPNPFNPVTHIKYAVPSVSQVYIEIFSILGQRVRTLVNEQKTPGYYTIVFDASSLASGFYIYRMRAKGFLSTKKLLILK